MSNGNSCGSDIGAGVCLGAFTGLLIGLATQSALGGAITAMLALLGGFFGTTRALGLADTNFNARIIAFCLAAIVALLIGTCMRTHDVFAPKLADQAAAYKALGFTDKEARDLVVFKSLGVRPTDRLPTAAPPAPATGSNP